MRTCTAVISIQNLTAEALPVLTQALKAVSGVESVGFSVERSVASVDFDPSQATVDHLLRAVLKAGYTPL
jgi:copper chaperone CopZ